MIHCLEDGHHFDGQYLVAVVDDLFRQQGGIGSNAYDILVIVVVGNAVNIHREGEGLILCNRRDSRELNALHPKVQPEFSQVDEGGENSVQLIIQELIELPLGKHGKLGNGDLQFIHFQCYIIAMEIPAVVYILAFAVDDGIIAR